MKKYQDYTKEQLIKVIEEKNITISRLNGEVYYHKDFKDKYQKLKKESRNQQEEINNLKKAEEYDSRYNDLQAEIDYGEKKIEEYQKILKRVRIMLKSSCCQLPLAKCTEFKNCKECGRMFDSDTIKAIIKQLEKFEVLDGNT